MDSKRAVHSFLVSALLLIYIVVRLWKLTDSCLWFDEIFSVHAAEHDWPSLIRFVAADLIHPPLFYLLLKVWILIGGESLEWLRLFSVIFAAAATIPLLLLCRELKFDRLTTGVALFLAAVNGSLIRYAQEVRMYSLLVFLSVVSIWLFSRYFHRGKGIIALTLTNLLLVYTHYFGWFIVIAELVAIISFQRIKIRAVGASFVLILIGFAPWGALIIDRYSRGADVAQNIGWINRPGARELVQWLLSINEPFYYQRSNIDPYSIWFASVPLVVVFLVSIAIYFLNEDERATSNLLAIIIGVPVILAFVLSWVLPLSIWGSRHLAIVTIPSMMLVATAITRITQFRHILIAFLVMVIAAAFFVQLRTPRQEFIWCAWEVLAQQIPDDSPQTVYMFEDVTAYSLWFARRSDQNISVVKVNGIPEIKEDAAYFLPREFQDVRKIDVSEMKGDHFWVAFRDMKWNERHPPINVLLATGYKTSPPIEVDMQGTRAFLVEVYR